MPFKEARAKISKRLKGSVDLKGSVTASLRTALHSVLMPLARTHLAEAEAAAARDEPPLGHVAAFVLLSHCALSSFLWSTWQDRDDARPATVVAQMREAKAKGKRGGIDFYEFVKAVGRGADGKQSIDSSDLRAIEEYIQNRNNLLQHSLQQYEDAGQQTTVRITFTVEYGKKTWRHLNNAIRAVSQKYSLDASWLDRC
jgi:hypothetical protein